MSNPLTKRGQDLPFALVDNFKLMMQYSVASYCPSTTHKKTWTCGVRCEGSTTGTVLAVSAHDSKLGTGGFVGVNTNLNAIIVSFKGTDNLQSAIQDAKFWQTTAQLNDLIESMPGEAKVHFGFKESYVSLRDPIQSALDQVISKYPTSQIYFTGHSLGGAMTQLAAVDFVDRHSDAASRVSVYTFGQPRVGNLDFANYVDTMSYTSRIFRVAKEGDIVPHVPPTFLGYYHHLSQFEVLKKNKGLFECQPDGPAGESKQCQLSLNQLDLLQHITGYFDWWTYPWFC